MIDIDFDKYSNEELRDLFNMDFYAEENEIAYLIYDYLIKNDKEFSDSVTKNNEILDCMSEAEIIDMYKFSSRRLFQLMKNKKDI